MGQKEATITDSPQPKKAMAKEYVQMNITAFGANVCSLHACDFTGRSIGGRYGNQSI